VHIDAPTPIADPFPISAVKLAPDSLFGIAQQRNLEYMLTLNDTQWLCQMTSAANLTECVGKCATTGGAGAPQCEQLPGEMGPGGYYGHYQGHYLSACAMMFQATGDSRIKAKADGLVSAMAKVQGAWSGKTDFYGVPSGGFLFSNYADTFGIMEGRCGLPGPKIDYSVPYYTLHKLMAGLLDQYQLAGNEEAFTILTKLADWVVLRVEATLRRGGESLWQCVLNTEWGGMNEVLYNLYAVTGNEAYLKTGLMFNHWQWTSPLAIGEDDLDASYGNAGGNHANTHIPEIIGSARGFELTGNATQKAIVTNFFKIVTTAHSWATGGSNDREHWTTPNRMGDQLNADTEESCTQYNILKVARHMFQWSGSSDLSDFYERAILNGIIGNQNKLNPAMTQFIYMLPLGAASMHKPWGSSNQSFPCCWGSLTEQFSKLSDSIYFASPDHSTIFVNQFMSSAVRWGQKKATITQRSGFPASTTSTTSISVMVDAPISFTVKLRVPAWAHGANKVTVNGEAVEGVVKGTYLSITRQWTGGDHVDAHFPMSLSCSLVQDNRTMYNATMAWMYGPLVLAGIGSGAASTSFIPAGDPMDPDSYIIRNSSTALSFEAKGKDPLTLGAKTVHLIPEYQIMEETYAVYFKANGAPSEVPYVAGGATVPSATAGDWMLEGASTVSSKLAGLNDLRTDGPSVNSSMTLAHPITGSGHKIDHVSLTFRYLAGYDSDMGSWPVLSVELLAAETLQVVKMVYTSAPLDKYKFDAGDVYSPPIVANSEVGLSIDNNEPLLVRVTVTNNAHNVQIPLDPHLGLNVTVHWTASKWYTHAQYSGTGEEL